MELDARAKLLAAQEKQKFYYDQHAKPLKGLELEERVKKKKRQHSAEKQTPPNETT